ncbi:MAG: TldD/PmbA family protein [Ruminococcaceae bacterium]|nr:TldD/PmbA family protein [Oscillospiraceae bacterium]
MIEKQLLEELLGIAVSTGADFAEVFVQQERSNQIRLLSGKIESVRDFLLAGVGIRAFLGTKTYYASTSDTSRAGLLKCAAAVAGAVGDASVPAGGLVTGLINEPVQSEKIKYLPDDVPAARKAEILREASDAAANLDEKISQVQGTYMDVDRHFLVANTEGLCREDRKIRTRLAINVVASDGGENQSGFYGPGGGMGIEFFEKVSPKAAGERAAKQALTNLSAIYCPAGTMTVAIENGFGGVIFHEACGHSLEATSVGIGASQMAGKLGQQIANPKVTAIDDGTIPHGWGSFAIDDEGNPARRNVLIENGILKNYMIDRLGSRRMGMPMTGNSRRENYTYEPTSRMTNTFIDNGPDQNEDIIASIEYGLYAKAMGGGSVNPLTGEFNFSVKEGYLVRNGKICEPVRGASLIGTGAQILRDIDMVGQNLATGQGVCGSSSGSVPTDVGQPLIRVSKITVGGRS